MAAAGVAKLIEECGELQQVLGKKLAWFHTDEPHWDGTNLNERIEDEMADVQAAILFVMDQLSLDYDRIGLRLVHKRNLFEKWHATEGNNRMAIDGFTHP